MCWLAVKIKIAQLPKGATWLQLYAVSLLCGIGFTMSLFIGTLAYEDQGLTYQTSVKVGVIIGSLASATLAADRPEDSVVFLFQVLDLHVGAVEDVEDAVRVRVRRRSDPGSARLEDDVPDGDVGVVL